MSSACPALRAHLRSVGGSSPGQGAGRHHYPGRAAPHPDARRVDGAAEVDLVVRGEAEETLIEMCARSSGSRVRPVIGLPSRVEWRDASGQVNHNPVRLLRKQIEGIPWPAYHLFKIERYTNLHR